MADRPPFDLVRAAFYLLAFVMAVAMLETLLAICACVWIGAFSGRPPTGACVGVGPQVRELVSELLTAILALLLAGRTKP